MKRVLLCAATAALAAAAVAVPLSSGSSHREAPNILLDPTADNTDTYAFVSPDAPGALTVVANWIPGEVPANGPNFFRFDDRADYYINIENTGDGAVDLRYLFKFKTTVRNPNSYLYAAAPVNSVYDKNLNTFQTYTLTREVKQPVKRKRRRKGKRVRLTPAFSKQVLATDVPVAPSNVGQKTMPNYGKLAAQAIKPLPGGAKVFAGQRDDPFFVDLGTAFDNINFRKTGSTGNQGGGKDDFADMSTETAVLQVPKSDVTRDRKSVDNGKSPNAVVGVWASTERKALQVTSNDYNSETGSRGGAVQVSRLGNPLFNEVLNPLGRKDEFNRTQPEGDGKRFGPYVLNSELAAQINRLYPVVRAPERGRTDLAQVFLTGIPGLNQIRPNPVPSDTLKINLGIPPTRTPNRFGVLGGDPQGFPNGRRLADDVVDIEVELVAGYLKGNKVALGDGVDQNDKAFNTGFPYLAAPTSGFDSNPSQRREPDHTPTSSDNSGGPSAPTPATPGGGTTPVVPPLPVPTPTP